MTQPITPAVIHFNDSNTPVADNFEDVYFSNHDGREESLYVFLTQNQLEPRFSSFHADGTCHINETHEATFVIGETGFGSGLNFLNVLHLWQKTQTATSTKKLHFISCEQHPLCADDLSRILVAWPELQELSALLLAQYPPLIKGMHSLEITDSVTLTLIFDDVVSGFKQLLDLPETTHFKQRHRLMDAWFLDGFSPAKNPDMWRPDVFEVLAQLSHRGTTLATFTAAGFVNRGLKNVGFHVKKFQGFGRKREMITAIFEGLPAALPPLKEQRNLAKKTHFWPIYQTRQAPKRIAIIGAGIAGITAAQTLKSSGFHVTLIDQSDTLINAANPQAVLFPSFSKTDSPLTRFHFHAFFFALRYYQKHFPAAFNASPLLQLIADSGDAQNNAAAIGQRYLTSGLVTHITPEEASRLANTQVKQSALYYPKTGWIDPQKVKTSSTLQGVDIQYETRVNALHYEKDGQHWCLATSQGDKTVDAVVIANASEAENLLKALDPNLCLKTGNIRGQVTQVEDSLLPSLHTIICHEGYICPKPDHSQPFCLGASYDLNNNNPALSAISQQENIRKLTEALPEFNHLNTASLPVKGKVGFRCTTRDYLPLVGPVPKSCDYLQKYAALRHNKNAYLPSLGAYHPQLWVMTGFGSKGFSSAPLSAAILRSYLTGGFFPVESELVRALHPARFLIRAIIQNNAPQASP